MSEVAPRMVCSGCGFEAAADEPYPFACPERGKDDVDHVMTPATEQDDETQFASLADPEADPFIRFRELSFSYRLARSRGMSDLDYVALVRRLDHAVSDVEGVGFRFSPFGRRARLSARLGFQGRGGIWVKDETHNVGGSHKARHLMGLAIHLAVVEELGLIDAESGGERRLAIASCGNAALAAAIVAKAAGRWLSVYIPPDAQPSVVERLHELEAEVVVTEREPGAYGDPCYLAFLAALEYGALPFCCQGPDNGLTIQGGETIAYELVTQLLAEGTALDHLFIQVGGGALASAVVQGLERSRRLGALRRLPRIHTVQTLGAWPLKRAYDRVVALAKTRVPELMHGRGDSSGVHEQRKTLVDDVCRWAGGHRSRFMWPWEKTPQSIAHGILDDETYDWLVCVRGMMQSGGQPLVVEETTLVEANRLARTRTDIEVCHSGSAGLAGALQLLRTGGVSPEDRVGVIFSGMQR